MNGIHSTVPEKNKAKQTKIDLLKPRLLKALKTYHCGKNNAVTTDALAESLRTGTTGTHQPIRAAAKELLLIDREPVIACSKGFFYAVRAWEVTEYIETMVARMNGIKRDLGTLRVIHDKLEKVETGLLL